MSQLKRRGGREGGCPNKGDTPVKPAMNRRDKCRRFLSNKRYAALLEEPEVDEMNVRTNPVSVGIKRISSEPVRCKSVLRLSSPAFAENPEGKVISPAAPAGHPSVQMTPNTEAVDGGDMQVKEEEQNLAVTLEGITSSSMELDTTFSSNDDEEEDSSASTASSLPSPEIFRKDNYVDTVTSKEELLGLHRHIKNSTLLDSSHAQTIHMYHPSNLSTVIDASAILAENSCENQHEGPEAVTKIPTDSFTSDTVFKWKTPTKLTKRRPILCKKKVWFKSPMIVETFEAKPIPDTKLDIHNTGGPVQMSSQVEQIKPDSDTSRAGEISSKDETLKLVRLNRQVKSSPQTAKFFDFIDDSDREAFFQRLRERCVKLKSAPLFPLAAANTEAILCCDI